MTPLHQLPSREVSIHSCELARTHTVSHTYHRTGNIHTISSFDSQACDLRRDTGLNRNDGVWSSTSTCHQCHVHWPRLSGSGHGPGRSCSTRIVDTAAVCGATLRATFQRGPQSSREHLPRARLELVGLPCPPLVLGQRICTAALVQAQRQSPPSLSRSDFFADSTLTVLIPRPPPASFIPLMRLRNPSCSSGLGAGLGFGLLARRDCRAWLALWW